MKLKSEQSERILWVLAIGLALLLRLLHLGAAPLTEWEAGNALPIFDWLQSGITPDGAQAGYTLFSGIVYFLFGASNYAARVIPALAGCLLVLAPLLFRRQLGRWPALMVAFGLALDPALTAISRQADGSTWAIAFTLLALGALLNRRYVWGGLCLGLALLGGPTIWMGWPGLGAALLAGARLSKRESSPDMPAERPEKSPGTIVLFAALVTLAAAGTLFWVAPFGLSMAAGSLVEFFRSWTQPGILTVQTATLALLSYATLPLVLGAIQIVSGWVRREAVDQFLSIWLVVALLLWLACPARQIGNAGWVMVPLWGLAARQAALWLRKPALNGRFTAAMAVAVFVLLFFAILNAVAILHPSSWSANTDVQWIKIAIALAVLGLAILLVGWGWSWNVSGQGLQWGLGAVLSILLVAMSVRASGLGARPQTELWRSGAYIADSGLMLDTLQDLSTHKTGQYNRLQVSVVGIQSPALRWLLRDFAEVEYSDGITAQMTPDIILTGDQIQPGQITTYRGQDFVWAVQPTWGQMTGENWVKWLVFREAPQETSKIILWARTDLFPGGASVETNP